MKLTKERRKQLYTQYRWIYALPNGICLLLNLSHAVRRIHTVHRLIEWFLMVYDIRPTLA